MGTGTFLLTIDFVCNMLSANIFRYFGFVFCYSQYRQNYTVVFGGFDWKKLLICIKLSVNYYTSKPAFYEILGLITYVII